MSQKPYGVFGKAESVAKKKRIAASRSLSVGLKAAISLGKTIASSGSLASLEDHAEIVELDEHAVNMLTAMYALWQQKLGCDIVIRVANVRFLAHKTIMATCSGYFHDLLLRFNDRPVTDRDGRCDVTLSDISSGAFQAILESIYSGKIHVDVNNITEILDAANKLKVLPIIKVCERFLRKHLSKENCLRLASLAYRYNMVEIEEEAINLAAANFMEASSTIDFLDICCDQLLNLFGRDDLRAESELDVFYRLLDWLRHDQSNRMKNASNLLKMVRLPLLPPSVIVDHVESSHLLMGIPECQELVKEALHYHCLPARQSILQSSRTVPRSTVQFQCIVTIGGAPRLKNQLISREVNYLDPTDSKWHRLTSLNEPRHHHAVAVLGGFIYVAGGEMTNDQRSPLNTVYRYDPRSDIWLQVASMKHQRESFQLAVLNGHLYAIGGRVNENKSLSTVECYNPSVDSWVTVASLSSSRRSIAVASYNGRIYAVGGSGDGKICGKVERYNPLLNKWESRRPLKIPRFFGLLAPVKNRLFLIGGATLDSTGNVICASTVECYTPLNDTWTTVNPMQEPRAEAGLAVLGHHIYVIGGYSWDKGKRLDSVERYDAELNSWESCTAIDKPYTGVGCCSVKLYRRKIDNNMSCPVQDTFIPFTQWESLGMKESAVASDPDNKPTTQPYKQQTREKPPPRNLKPAAINARLTKSKITAKPSDYEQPFRIKSQPTVVKITEQQDSDSTVSLPENIQTDLSSESIVKSTTQSEYSKTSTGANSYDVIMNTYSHSSDDILSSTERRPDESASAAAAASSTSSHISDVDDKISQTSSSKNAAIGKSISGGSVSDTREENYSETSKRSISAAENKASPDGETEPQQQEVAKLSSSEAFQQIPDDEKNKCGIV
ncbi:kelch-like protein 31 [Tubulanus polymorphus]|uniref:kelch-like protein 31 n=1 Tax=Tubulanus polymorphus TaxID=672921 RepID=UPI003DA5E239